MDLLYRAFDLFVQGAKWFAGFLPQSGSDVLQMFQSVLRFLASVNFWIIDNLGINFQRIGSTLGRLLLNAFNFVVELVKNLVQRI